LPEQEVTLDEQVTRFLRDTSLSNDLNRLPEQYGGDRIFDAPLPGVSAGNDPIFGRYKEVVAPEHLTPIEMWSASGLLGSGDSDGGLRILSMAFPYTKRIRSESEGAVKMPADIYSLGRNYANDFISDVQTRTVEYFRSQGHRALAPSMSPAFRILRQEKPPQFYSVWSERHIAFAGGLGTFSLHEGLITEAGCNVRLASVITDAPLDVTPRERDDPYANCLYYAKGECRECERRCPGDAISEAGHDKAKCREYGRIVAKEMSQRLGSLLKPREQRVGDGERVSYAVGCAFCQFAVPCMDRIPIA